MSSTLNLEVLLAIIKPHAVSHRCAILRRIQMAGIHVHQERCVKLSVEQAITFLHRKSKSAPMEIEYLSSGPMIVLCLARENVIEVWNDLMGPENCVVARKSSPSSLRALYGDPDNEMMNAVHGSKSRDDVEHDLNFFFPNMSLEPVPSIEDANGYLCSIIYQPLTDALYEMVKAKPDDPLEWLANFMLTMKEKKKRTTLHRRGQQSTE